MFMGLLEGLVIWGQDSRQLGRRFAVAWVVGVVGNMCEGFGEKDLDARRRRFAILRG